MGSRSMSPCSTPIVNRASSAVRHDTVVSRRRRRHAMAASSDFFLRSPRGGARHRRRPARSERGCCLRVVESTCSASRAVLRAGNTSELFERFCPLRRQRWRAWRRRRRHAAQVVALSRYNRQARAADGRRGVRLEIQVFLAVIMSPFSTSGVALPLSRGACERRRPGDQLSMQT